MDANLKEALLKLDVDNDNHWTEQGLPRIETLKFLTGDVSITRESINTTAPGFNRSNREIADVAPEVTTSVVIEAPVVVEPIAVIEEQVPVVQTLEEGLRIAQLELDQLVQEFGLLQNQVFEKTKEVHSLAEQVANAKPVETSQTAIQSYLRSEQGVLEERGVRLEMIARSGIKLKDLADNLKSPLDASLARKR
jgi:hypothetical protein